MFELAAKIALGEVIDVNSNSYETIRIVLKNLRDQVCLGVNREWVRTGFDGVP